MGKPITIGIPDLATARAIRELRGELQAELDLLERELTRATDALSGVVGGLVTGVSSVTAGSSAVSVSPTTGAVVVDVVEANFSGIPQAAVTDLVSDLAARPTGSGTINKVAKWTAGSALGDSSITDTGSLVTIASPINVTGAADFDSTLLVNSTLTVNGAVDFDSTLDVDGAANFDSTLTLSLMTPGSVFFAGTGGLVSQDNANLYWNDTDNRLGIGTSASPSNPLHVKHTGTLENTFLENTHTTTTAATLMVHSASNTAGAITLRNTNVAGPADFNMYDNSNTLKASFGYGNASYSDATRAGKVYGWRNTGVAMVFACGNPAGSTSHGAISSTGDWTLGAATTNSHTVNGRAAISNTTGSVRALSVTSSASGTHVLDLRNTSGSGYSGIGFNDSGGTEKLGFGYDNNLTRLYMSMASGVNMFWYGNGTQRVAFFNGGEVNVGATASAPSTLFRVEGTAAITSTLAVTGNFAVNTNKFTVTASSGDTVVAGTLGVTGLATLTGGFTLGTTGNANSNKITNLTNGSSAQDAAAFGQIATAVSAAVSGTANTIAKFTGTNVVGNSSVTDDGTTFAINVNKFTVTEASGNTVVAGTFNAQGAGDFDSTLNVDGYAGFGAAPASSIQVRVVQDPTRPFGVHVSSTASGYTGQRATVIGNSSGTFDTTIGDIDNFGLTSTANGTRSAGANNLTNYGVYTNASGGQVNYAFYGAAGQFYNNGNALFENDLTVQGTLTAGDADGDAATVNGTLAVNKSGADSTTGLYVQNDARLWSLLIDGSNSDRFHLRDESGGVYAMIASPGGNVAFPNGVTIGDAAGDAHSITGTLNANGTAGSNGDVLTLVTGVPKWSTPLGGGNVTAAGLTTNIVPKASGAAALVDSSLFDNGTVTSTTASFSVYGTPSIQTDGVTVGFTAPNGIVASKNSGGAPASNLYLQTTDVSAITSTVLALGYDLSATFYGAVAVASTLAVDGNTTLGNSTSDTIYAPGYLGVGTSPTVGAVIAADVGTRTYGVYSTFSTAGHAGSVVGLDAQMSGSLDATAAGREAYGVISQVSTTRSSGANATQNYGGYFTASGGTALNYAIYASASGAGAYNFVGGAGAFTNGGAATFGSTLGVTGAVDFDSTLNVDGAATFNGDVTIGNAGGDNLDVNCELSKFATTTTGGFACDGATYIYGDSLNFGYALNSAVTGYINYNGYNNGTTQFRNLIIADGKNATVATFDGSTKGLDVVGPLNGYTQLTLAADQDVTNNTNQDMNTLQFAVTATKIYAVEINLIVSGNNATGDYEFRAAVSAGTMDGRGTVDTFTTSDAINSAVWTAAAAANTGNVSIGTAADLGIPIPVTATYVFRQNTSNGTFKLQFGNNSASGGRTSRTLAGSYIRYKQLN